MNDTKSLPMPIKVDPCINNDVKKLVNEMLALYKTPELRESNRLKIAAVDHEIDQLVYKLYGLTDEEIKVVEGE